MTSEQLAVGFSEMTFVKLKQTVVCIGGFDLHRKVAPQDNLFIFNASHRLIIHNVTKINIRRLR